jgi:SET domain-containing protein
MLFIAQSTLPGAGKGLFTSKPIKKGTVIAEYTGDIITFKEYEERVRKNRYGYLVYINRQRCIDAWSHKKSLARYANDARGFCRKKGVTNNARYEIRGNRCYIVAMRDIAAGSEILVNYGAQYWRDMRYNQRLERLLKKKKAKKKKQ